MSQVRKSLEDDVQCCRPMTDSSGGGDGRQWDATGSRAEHPAVGPT